MDNNKALSPTGVGARSRDVGLVPQSTLRKPRLPVMPLAVLLPQFGELGKLPSLAAQFEKRHQELLGATQRFSGEEDAEGRRERLAEESMLNQALQWLQVGTDIPE